MHAGPDKNKNVLYSPPWKKKCPISFCSPHMNNLIHRNIYKGEWNETDYKSQYSITLFNIARLQILKELFCRERYFFRWNLIFQQKTNGNALSADCGLSVENKICPYSMARRRLAYPTRGCMEGGVNWRQQHRSTLSS